MTPPSSGYAELAEDLVRASAEPSEPAALARVREAFGAPLTAIELRSQIARRLGAPESQAIDLDAARALIARLFHYGDWAEFEAAPAAHAYEVDPADEALELRPPLLPDHWNEIFDLLGQRSGITSFRASGQGTDALLERLSQGAGSRLTHLSLDGCRRVSDAGLAHLAAMPQLERLDLSGCDGITDAGLAALLPRLPALREFSLQHHHGISDAGLAHLRHAERIERVDLLGSAAGDGVLAALAGKPNLRHLRSGNLVTDRGLALLQEFPVFRAWRPGLPARVSLMSFDAEPNYLLLRGAITDAGLAHLAGLDGLFALNLDDSRLAFSPSAVTRHLGALPHLGWLGLDTDDATMAAVATLPRLEMLMCQDTRAGDEGFVALSRSPSLRYIWGRRCYNLTGRGFAALSDAPSLQGLSVSCRNVDDAALARLPHFPSLREFMPMDVPDAGFRHVGACTNLEALWCMYCRETGDEATSHLSGLVHLRRYYAGQTRITDGSLEMLSRLSSLEHMELWSCPDITNLGIAHLAKLPRLAELILGAMPRVTRIARTALPFSVRVKFER